MPGAGGGGGGMYRIGALGPCFAELASGEAPPEEGSVPAPDPPEAQAARVREDTAAKTESLKGVIKASP